ncbi:BZ3500_MvSof-1268-A1-R1_Chr2-2g05116 [Microbotryum saponariae]|uniref:BZ3500_MvSof-1268-A1-R1_Chr2-2g05116 protein n=1 Tax=Microbotryum saponariae TaxID=289078 RepID=A0A2X0LPC0_9BASI|nr:BZ3500_MvSof-1268-A1-R1_Chr2-2g05116 [Microbotryum saponariae]SDA00943.1 BZ3501_MvSof-1269-A2-R1_Chr2-2g04790 [Microbotryum saponariae]
MLSLTRGQLKVRPSSCASVLATANRGAGLRRSLHDQGVWGYQSPRQFTLPDFTSQELQNRAENASLLRLVESYRRHGHRSARLDPLDLAERPNVPALDTRRYGFKLSAPPSREEFRSEVLPPSTAAFQSTEVDTRGILDFPENMKDGVRSIEEISEWLSQVYCGGIGYEVRLDPLLLVIIGRATGNQELTLSHVTDCSAPIQFMHLPSKHERRFLEQMLETSHSRPIPSEKQLEYWRLLAASEGFDAWAAKRFPNVKRYGLEGAESMMVALAVLMEDAERRGIQESVIAMPHRGRLNVLTQLFGMDMRLLVRKMRGLPTLPKHLKSPDFLDDVLSHLFLSAQYTSSMGVHLLPNPSHLEAVGPVALGFARGLQVPFSDTQDLGEKVLSIQIHGDAAFGGQGVVSESLNLADLPHFTVGGSIRIVVNNQLGYTTPASSGRTSFYATDLAKSIAAPIIHVNGDRVEDVARAMSLALAYQQKFKKDVVIDLVVYRRRGHNELDEPAYTSPTMYQKIANLPSVPQMYEKQLIEASILDPAVAAETRKALAAQLDKSLVASEPNNFTVPDLDRPRGWDKMKWPVAGEWAHAVETGVEVDALKRIGKQSVEIPSDITIHPRLGRMHISKRLQSLEFGSGIDFATAEALAFGSLMEENYHVRLDGQDSGRGTFSQRHAIFADQNSSRTTVPLQKLGPGKFEVVNSPLSEYAVVGFEQGVAWVSPNILSLWEAQFGDFNNTAQVILDTFLGSGETKWGLQSALTLLLPHGFDSAGPEHSSAKIERFLQLTNEPMARKNFVPNIHLVNVTTSAQYFHLLRRQMKREYRKPLVVFSPKGILRLPSASSSLSELGPRTSFQPVLSETLDSPEEKVQRVVFLSGKMYYDLIKERTTRSLDGAITFVRVEEISPFPYAVLEKTIQAYPNARSFVWAQEEPENAGAYTFVYPRLSQILPSGHKLEYVGREAMATTAPGVSSYFAEQKKVITEQVFEGLSA